MDLTLSQLNPFHCKYKYKYMPLPLPQNELANQHDTRMILSRYLPGHNSKTIAILYPDEQFLWRFKSAIFQTLIAGVRLEVFATVRVQIVIF
jgi:hypothetical protein